MALDAAPLILSAPAVGDALSKVGRYKFAIQLNDVTRAFFSQTAALEEPAMGKAMKALVANPADKAAIAVVTGDPKYNSMLRTTCVATELKGGHATNALPQLAEANINVDMIIQNIAKDKGETDVTFTVPKADLPRTQALLEERKEAIGFFRMISDDRVAKISVVGVGMRSHAGVAKTMFQALSDKGINIQVISTSEIKISVLIDASYTELAVRALHTAYGLDSD